MYIMIPPKMGIWPLSCTTPFRYFHSRNALGDQRMKRVSWLLVMLVVVAGVTVLPASADTFFSNFGPGNSYNCCVGGTISGPTSAPGWIIQANQFTAGFSGSVSQIDVAMGYVTGALNGATISLWSDNGGIPGSQLGSWNITNLTNFGSCCAV